MSEFTEDDFVRISSAINTYGLITFLELPFLLNDIVAKKAKKQKKRNETTWATSQVALSTGSISYLIDKHG